MMNALMQEAIEWCKGKNWMVRAPLLAYFAYVLFRHLSDPLYSSIIGGINLGIHELGHMVFGIFGQGISVAGGTIFQLALPVFAGFNFYRQRDFFAIALSFGWLSTNFFNIATYIADARRQELPLVSIGGGAVWHDWEYAYHDAIPCGSDTPAGCAFDAGLFCCRIMAFVADGAG